MSQDDKSSTDQHTTVMIVEDEVLVAMDLEAMLDGYGYGVLGPVATVEQALALLNQERPDAALLDVSLKGNEWSSPVADALREAGIPYLLMSAYGPSELEASGLLKGTQNLGKPVVERQLVEALADVLTPSA